MAERYSIKFEISGPTAIWTRPDSGDCPVSYPAPTYSAAKGIIEAILFNQAVEVVPTKVEICAPIIFHTYNTNYGGPLRKSKVIEGGGSYQLLASVLVNPCYRIYADLRTSIEKHATNTYSSRTIEWLKKTTSAGHAYQDMFYRRLKRGQCHYIPCLGWKEFTPDYVGDFRPDTRISSDVELTLPSMLRQVFPDGLHSDVRFVYGQNVSIRKGVIEYPERPYAQ